MTVEPNGGTPSEAAAILAPAPALADRSIVVTQDIARVSSPGELVITTPCGSLEEIKTLVTGHSNALALRVAMVRGDAMALARSLGMGALAGRLTDEDLSSLLSLGHDRNIALVWNGNQANEAFLIATQGVFDFIPRGWPDKTTLPGCKILPESLIRAYFQVSMNNALRVLRTLRTPAGARRFFVGTPPPLGSNDVIRQRWSTEPALVSKAEGMGIKIPELPLTPASVRLKLWHVLQEVMRETAMAAGWIYVPVAPEALDPEGFLKLELSIGVTHGNAKYGEAMIRQLQTFL